MAMSREAPSLVKLCVGTVIANLRYVGDLSGVDLHLLKDILPHCTIDQLICIENSTQEVDLSPVTNDLWKRFYGQQFGEENMMLVVRRMKQKQVVFKWKKLYEAKLKEREVFRSKSFERLKQRYEEELAKKQSKQIRICSKIPPSGNKRSFSSVSSSYKVSHIKGNLMKKAKLEYLKSREACMHASMRKKFEHRKSLPSQSSLIVLTKMNIPLLLSKGFISWLFAAAFTVHGMKEITETLKIPFCADPYLCIKLKEP